MAEQEAKVGVGDFFVAEKLAADEDRSMPDASMLLCLSVELDGAVNALHLVPRSFAGLTVYLLHGHVTRFADGLSPQTKAYDTMPVPEDVMDIINLVVYAQQSGVKLKVRLPLSGRDWHVVEHNGDRYLCCQIPVFA